MARSPTYRPCVIGRGSQKTKGVAAAVEMSCVFVARLPSFVRSRIKTSLLGFDIPRSPSSSSSSSQKAVTPLTSIVFDRDLKQRQREWARRSHRSDDYDYLREECARRLVDRLDDISKPFSKVLELGAFKGHVLRAVDTIVDRGVDIKTGVNSIKDYTLTDSSQLLLDIVDTSNKSGIKVAKMLCDSEELDNVMVVADGSDEDKFDMVMTSLDFHWVNDIPATMKKVKSILKPDGIFIGCMLGGSTLSELR